MYDPTVDPNSYWATPRANISRDGQFIAFTSNWGVAGGRLDVFIVKIPPAPPLSDTTPPIISGVASSNVSSSGATITWSTNEASDSQVEYGTTTSYGSSTTLNTSLVTSHSQSLTGLSASTLYHYRVKSRDAAGNLATSGDFTFTTSSSSVVWTSLVNCTATGGTIQKTAGVNDGSFNAGGISQQAITSGDGYIEFSVAQMGGGRFCGLSDAPSSTDFTAIDYALEFFSTYLEVRENNVYKGDMTYAAGDVFRIAVVGGVVKYSKNGVVFYTSTKAVTYPLKGNAVFSTLNAAINNAVMR